MEPFISTFLEIPGIEFLKSGQNGYTFSTSHYFPVASALTVERTGMLMKGSCPGHDVVQSMSLISRHPFNPENK